MRERYGLDFGTSNSSIAIHRNGGVQVLPVDPSSVNPRLASSVLFVDRQGQSWIGAEAIKVFVERNSGREIVRKRVSSGKIIETVFGDEYVTFDADTTIPGRFFQAIKTFLRDQSYEGTDVFGRFYTIEQLAAEMLRQIKTRGDALVGHPVDAVVMGRPVHFSTDEKQDALAERRLREAARQAGFADVEFMMEPIGAALAYEADLKREEIAFVFDFGGGTLDFTVMRLGPGHGTRADRRDDILAVGGVVVGGNTFDEDIMSKRLVPYFGSRYIGRTMTGTEIRLPRWIQAQLRTWYTMPLLNERETIKTIKELAVMARQGRKDLEALLTLIQKNYGWDLFQEIERGKITLSSDLATRLQFRRETIKIDEPLSRKQFEAIIAGRLRLIGEEMDRTLEMAGVMTDRVDVVIRTGGSSLIPAVQTMLERKFGPQKVNKQEVFTSVVTGLALAAARE